MEEWEDEGTLVMEQRFSIVPEWVLDAEISDAALRLYAVLLRYGQTSGNRMPSRKLLAQRMRKKSRDTVDRALKELVAIGAVVVRRRRQGNVFLSNSYIVRSTPARPRSEGGRTHAVTPTRGRTPAATVSRTDAATVAADVGHNPKQLTQKNPPPPSPSPAARADAARHLPDALAEALSGHDLEDVVARCRASRAGLGLPTGRWTARVLGDVLADAVSQGWPADVAVPALLAIAGDRETRSPARLVCPGPWWDAVQKGAARDVDERFELERLESRLAETGGRRVALQRRARQELEASGTPLTRLNVARIACAALNAIEEAP